MWTIVLTLMISAIVILSMLHFGPVLPGQPKP